MATLIPGAILGVVLSLDTGRADWIVLIGVFLLLGVSLDAGVYSWLLKYQPPWMTGVLALGEFGLLLVLANVLKLDLSLLEAIIFYWGVWSMAAVTRIVVLPIASLTYLESAGEFRRVEWSIPDNQASVPILAAMPRAGEVPGILERSASGADMPELQPSPSGIREILSQDGAAAARSSLRLVELTPGPGSALMLHGETIIGREGCDLNLDDPEISRRHAALRLEAGRLTVTDLGSSNGTYVNARLVADSRELVAGDELRIGPFSWKLEPALPGGRPTGVHGGQVTAIRGDVPPPEPQPSAIRRLASADQTSVGEPRFPSQSRAARMPRGSAARRVEATVISYLTVAATAGAVIGYLAQRG